MGFNGSIPSDHIFGRTGACIGGIVRTYSCSPHGNKLITLSHYVTRKDCRRPASIEKADGRYDLAVCLEVAEHLPESSASDLVRTLTTLAPIVLFSAAIPGQGGVGHINERWPSYWKSRFEEHGFQRLDPIRPHIWKNRRVHWWYRQNIFLFAAREQIDHSESLRDEEGLPQTGVFYMNCLNRYRRLRGGLAEIARTMLKAIRTSAILRTFRTPTVIFTFPLTTIPL